MGNAFPLTGTVISKDLLKESPCVDLPLRCLLGLFIISCLISVTVLYVTQHEEGEIFLTHYFTGLGLWLFDSMCISRVSWLWEHEGRAIHTYHGGQEAETGSWGPGITSEVYLWQPLSSKDVVLLLNVSRISPYENEMSSHMSLWGHISFSNHSKVQSMSVTIGHGELTCSLWPLKTNKSVL